MEELVRPKWPEQVKLERKMVDGKLVVGPPMKEWPDDWKLAVKEYYKKLRAYRRMKFGGKTINRQKLTIEKLKGVIKDLKEKHGAKIKALKEELNQSKNAEKIRKQKVREQKKAIREEMKKKIAEVDSSASA